MKLEYTSGCICNSLSIDGVESIDMNINDLKTVIHKLIDREQDLAVLQSSLIDCMQSQGNYECSKEPCDCCGDIIMTYTLEI